MIYTPTNDFLGIDSSTYKATLGSGNSSTKTATITVFGAFLDAPQQFGKNLSGATINNYSGSSASLSSNGKILAIGAYGYVSNPNSQSSDGKVRVYENIDAFGVH